MNPDDFKTAWQAHPSQPRLPPDADLVLQQVQHTHRTFTRKIFWRDVQEIGTSVVLVPVWIILGISFKLPWTWYLMLPALLWIAGFLLVSQWKQKSKLLDPGQPLRKHLEHSLAQVNDQIELLNKVFWWYLLPIILPMAAFFAQTAWNQQGDRLIAMVCLTLVVSIAVAVLGFSYWANKNAIRTHLVPLRNELQSQLQGLGEETSGDNPGDRQLI